MQLDLINACYVEKNARLRRVLLGGGGVVLGGGGLACGWRSSRRALPFLPSPGASPSGRERFSSVVSSPYVDL